MSKLLRVDFFQTLSNGGYNTAYGETITDSASIEIYKVPQGKRAKVLLEHIKVSAETYQQSANQVEFDIQYTLDFIVEKFTFSLSDFSNGGNSIFQHEAVEIKHEDLSTTPPTIYYDEKNLIVNSAFAAGVHSEPTTIRKQIILLEDEAIRFDASAQVDVVNSSNSWSYSVKVKFQGLIIEEDNT